MVIGLARDRRGQHEYRPALRLVLAGNLSLMFLHHAVHGAESQTCALADWLRGVERIENPIWLFNSLTAIVKLQDHLFCLEPGSNLKQTSPHCLPRVHTLVAHL